MSIPDLNIVNTQPRTTSRLFLTSMSGVPSSENPTEMIEPIYNLIDGVIWVLNDVPVDAPSARYLESVKGEGKIIHRCWSRGRHHHAMNDSLYCGPMEEGDFYLYCDDLERPAREFVSRIKIEIIPMMNKADVDVLFYFGKAYLVRYKETLEYRNSPHWSLHGWNGHGIEWNTIEPNERLVRLNVRPEKRKDKWHFVKHYLGYWLYPAGSNHAMLGLDKVQDAQKTFQNRETQRLMFVRLLKDLNIQRNADAVIQYMRGKMDPRFIAFVEKDKVLNDAYRYYILGRCDFLDNHDWEDLVKVEN